jgi:hypothetical protein
MFAMKRSLHPIPFGLIIMLLCSSILHSQCLLQKSSFDERWKKAELVVEGEVIEQSVFWSQKGGHLYTAHRVKIYKILKGSWAASEIEVISLGGIMGEEKMVATPSLLLEKEQKGLFLLKKYRGSRIEKNGQMIWRPVAANAGFLGYGPNLLTAKDLFEDVVWGRQYLYQKIDQLPGSVFKELQPIAGPVAAPFAPSITNISPLNVTAGTETMITITGTGFLNGPGTTGTVFFDDADDGSGSSYTAASSFHIQSWSDTQIEVLVPSGAGSGNVFVRDSTGSQSPLSSQSLTIPYNLLNVNTTGFPRPHLIDDMCDGDGGYTLNYSINTANNGVDFTTEAGGAAQSAFERAINTWQNTVGFSIYAGNGCGTTNIQVPSSLDDVNVITFDNDLYDLDVEASGSTLGITFSYWSKCGSSEWELEEIDMIYRRNGNPNGFGGSVNWEYGPSLPSTGEIDFESVVLHETGHAHQLGHVIAPGDIMHYVISQGASNRTLDSDTQNGANDVEALSIAYDPPFVNCNPPGDFTCSTRDYAVYNTGADCSLLLPVELLQLEGARVQSGVELSWKTAVEVDNDYFILERSPDGVSFEPITEVDGKGNSSSLQTYLYLDAHPFPGINYYQLIQVDSDGSQWPQEQIVQIFFPSQTNFSLAPNPASGDVVNLFFSTEKPVFIQIRLFDLHSRLIRKEERMVSREMRSYPLSIRGLPQGLYFLEISAGGRTETLRFLRKK